MASRFDGEGVAERPGNPEGGPVYPVALVKTVTYRQYWKRTDLFRTLLKERWAIENVCAIECARWNRMWRSSPSTDNVDSSSYLWEIEVRRVQNPSLEVEAKRLQPCFQTLLLLQPTTLTALASMVLYLETGSVMSVHEWSQVA
eukprot:6748554-Prymnesium_polylepis.1